MSAARRIIPLLDRVLVRRVKPEQRTASGIYLPEKSVEALQEGHVIAVGKGGLNKDGNVVPVTLKEGDRVVLPQFGGSTVKVNKEELLLLRENEILAKVEE
ncbi:mitochondrial heat shock protein Hsp10 [Dispira parvispora]|uniref:Mitochondrial heat shock protein Hsp10 n=1 Tax=Dispira parvispora TaxID=1520584 RepID=A0A9W8ASZ2_9FUNG|nr:mitochondrial heat shock protein Hsp10 [Dispira parvispora]